VAQSNVEFAESLRRTKWTRKSETSDVYVASLDPCIACHSLVCRTDTDADHHTSIRNTLAIWVEQHLPVIL